jgi:ribosomal protein S18 acetylase RimI-like enzyme
MNWFKRHKLARYFPIDTEGDSGEFEQNTGMDVYDAADQADKVFDSTNISYHRPKQISEVVMPDNEDRVVGATATGWSQVDGEADKPIYEYSFDLSVMADFQKQGIGRQLIANAIKRYESDKSDYEEMGNYTRMKVWAVNANVARILENEFRFDCEPVAYDNGEPSQWMCYRY